MTYLGRKKEKGGGRKHGDMCVCIKDPPVIRWVKRRDFGRGGEQKFAGTAQTDMAYNPVVDLFILYNIILYPPD